MKQFAGYAKPDEFADLSAAVSAGAVAGTRYDAAQMRMLNSEK
jgi:hypothetical protein